MPRQPAYSTWKNAPCGVGETRDGSLTGLTGTWTSRLRWPGSSLVGQHDVRVVRAVLRDEVEATLDRIARAPDLTEKEGAG